MWNRKELKARGKAAFRANYWRSVLSAFLLIGLTAAGGGSAWKGTRESVQETGLNFSSMTKEQITALVTVALVIVGAVATVSLIATLVKIFVWNPLDVGCHRFFFTNAEAPATLGELGYGFKNCYWDCVKTIFLRDLFLFLWALLFIVPAIVKSYSYRMVPYILADEPALSGTAAITRSREMMRGHKWSVFVLDLSFIGWYFLDALTLGILGVFYVHPYVAATDAELYRALKEEA